MKKYSLVAATTLAILLGGSVTQASASVILQQYNGPPASGGPLCCYWELDNIGWYWTTPADILDLTGIETWLYNGAGNINNDFNLTVTVYDERPAAAGTSLGSFTFNATNASGRWGGGSFTTPLSLNGNTQYFVGFSGWNQVLTNVGGGGINWVDNVSLNVFPAGTQFISTAYGFADFSTPLGNATTVTAAGVVRFVGNREPIQPPPTGVPEPSALLLLGIGLIGFAARRRRV